MKGDTVRNAINAHGWVGLIISVPLFLIFWAGAFTLFQMEVQQWATLAHFPVEKSERQKLPLNQLVNQTLQTLNFDNRRNIKLLLPSEHKPYIDMIVPTFDSNEQAKEVANWKAKQGSIPEEEYLNQLAQLPRSKSYKELLIDPANGKILADNHPFELAHFLDTMHYSLKLPQGLYLVGLVTFFFLVIVFTGIVIQFKNLIRNFFLYRHNKKTRYQMNDIHNVVGVISLPYGLMYALTGVMLNLSILFQIPTLFVLYQGDQESMVQDAGLAQVTQVISGKDYSMPNLDELIQDINQSRNTSIQRLNLYNYYDKHAFIRLNGIEHNTFAKVISAYYKVEDGSLPKKLNLQEESRFYKGIRLLYNIHMANYAGVDLRFIYFILAMGVCGMIIAGNVLWIAKRQKELAGSKTLAIARGLTLGGCAGAIPATAIAFLLERTLPVVYTYRADTVMYSFGIVLLICMIAAFLNKQYKHFVSRCFIASALILAILSIIDITAYGSTLIQLWQAQFTAPLGVSISVLFISILLAWVGVKVNRNH